MEREKQYNLECLRVLLMCMIVALHFLNQTDAPLLPDDSLSSYNLAGTFLESLCVPAVNTFVILSGYLGCTGSFRITRLIERILTVVFYSLLIFLVCTALHVPGAEDAPFSYRLLQMCFPISNRHYWYFTAYVLMYLLTPFLNAGVKTLSEKNLRLLLGAFLFFGCLLKSVVPIRFVTDRGGYDLFWFVCLYLCGAYLRTYHMPSRKQGALLYVGSCIAITVFAVVTNHVHQTSGRLADYAGIRYHYNFAFCLTAAVGLFSLFAQSENRAGAFSRFAARIAPYLPGVYLLHVHAETDRRWVSWMEGVTGPVPKDHYLLYICYLAGAVCVVMAAGIVVDACRALVFKGIRQVVRKR